MKLTLSVKSWCYLLAGGYMITGTAKTKAKAGHEAQEFQITAYAQNGPKLPDERVVFNGRKNEKSPYPVIIDFDPSKAKREGDKITISACRVLPAYDDPAPFRVVKTTGMPTKDAAKIYDQEQIFHLGSVLEFAGIPKPYGAARTIYKRFLKNLKRFGAEAEDGRPVYDQPWHEKAMGVLPEIWAEIGASPYLLDKIKLRTGGWSDWEKSSGRYGMYAEYILEHLGGDTYIGLEDFYKKIRSATDWAWQMPDVQRTNLDNEIILKYAMENPQLGRKDNEIYLARVRANEQKVAQRLDRLARKIPDTRVEIKADTTLSEEQAAAVSGIVNATRMGGVVVITGGPGTGKTTILKAALNTIEAAGTKPEKIALAAPTGKAAKRMAEATGHEAKTVHRLLEVDPIAGLGSFLRNSYNPLDETIIIVDEVSMLDISTLSSLLQAISTGSTLVLIGDADQLESVGPGAILRELLETNNRIKKYRLTQNYRQSGSGGAVIRENADRIISGNCELMTNENFEVFRIRNSSEMIMMFDKVIRSRKIMVCNPDVIAVSYTRAGCKAINSYVTRMRPQTKGITHYGRRFQDGDKVIFTRNNYSQDLPVPYFNGEAGIFKFENDLSVTLPDKTVRLSEKELSDLELAYAITGHKTQGSEYGTVIICIPDNGLGDRSWLYTVVTRAKSRVIIISENDALEKMIQKERTVRKTRLPRFLVDRNLITGWRWITEDEKNALLSDAFPGYEVKPWAEEHWDISREGAEEFWGMKFSPEKTHYILTAPATYVVDFFLGDEPVGYRKCLMYGQLPDGSHILRACDIGDVTHPEIETTEIDHSIEAIVSDDDLPFI